MNKKLLVVSASLGITLLTLSSYKNGPFPSEGNISGSGPKGATCTGAGCNSTGSSSNTFAMNASNGIVALYSDAGATSLVSGGYEPGKKYYVKLEAVNTSLLPKFGFQASCVSGASKVNAGTLAAIAGSNTVVRTGSINVIEHSTPLSISSTTYRTIFEWTAPPKGTGDVTFYVMVNAVNGTGTASGDQPSVGMTKVINEKPAASITENQISQEFEIFPNPCSNVINIKSNHTHALIYTIYDALGKEITGGMNQNLIDVATLQNGFYLIKIQNEQYQKLIPFVKQ